MPDAAPKSDAERIADLEAQVSALLEICANLHNGIKLSFKIAIRSQELSLARFAQREVPNELTGQIADLSKEFDTVMPRAQVLIWGPDDGEK